MSEVGPRKERISALALFVFSLVYFCGGLGLKIGRSANPGPGFLPFVIGILMIFFTGLNLFRTLRSKEPSPRTEEGEAPSPGGLFVSLSTAACVVVYPLLLRGLKYVLSTFLVMFVMLVINRFKHPALSALLALVIALSSFVFFYVLLGVVLPMGNVESFLLQLRLW